MEEFCDLVNIEKRKDEAVGVAQCDQVEPSAICSQPPRDDAKDKVSAELDTVSPILSHGFLPLRGHSQRT